MSETNLTKKLRISSGQKAVLIGEPAAAQIIRDCAPEGVIWASVEDIEIDYVHIFARYQAQIQEVMPAALACLKHDGLLWISYPKKSSKSKTDLDRDVFWTIGTPFRIRPVAQISLDETWSALRFRPAELVGK